MEPFFFGPEKRRLFGVYQGPVVPRRVPAAALLCYPVLREYLRSHRSFQRFAGQLAARGWHVLRFDYSGSGDSYGDGPADPDAWVQDIQVAAKELRERARTTRIALIGLRLGASLAASAAPRIQPLSELVLWDPVDGREYLSELLAFTHATTLSPAARRKIARLGGNDLGVGLEITPELMQAITRLNRSEQLNARAERILVLDTQKCEAVADFARCLTEFQEAVTLRRLPDHAVWVERDKLSYLNVAVPKASLQAILNWIGKSDA
jgi:uncharacterized protein